MAKVDLDIRSIETALQRALDDAANQLLQLYKQAFDLVAYVWPNDTKRRNRTTAGRSRDKVDLGNLKNSTSVSRQNLTLAFLWAVDYAAYVFFGYTTSSGTSYPPSDWIAVAHNIRSPEEVIGGACRAIFN
jgi:hypothetical protein